MTNIDKINYLNECVMNKEKQTYRGPASLFKYRSFDEYSFDMLENEYLYLCPAERLDDESECDVEVDIKKLMLIDTTAINFECISFIVETIKPYVNENDYNWFCNQLSRIIRPDGTIYPGSILNLSFSLENKVPQQSITNIVNQLSVIPKKINEPEIRSQLEPLIMKAINAKKELGICSLAESCNNQKMWELYANNYKGYCVEYDFSNYEYNTVTFPVIYSDDRDKDVVKQLVKSFVGQMINYLSNEMINADSTDYIRLFLTKNTKWEYQNEWRIIDSADMKINAPRIKRIILGKDVEIDNELKIINFANIHNVEIIKQK